MPTAAHLSTTARKRSNTPSMRPAANSTASSVINAEPASYPQISQTRQKEEAGENPRGQKTQERFLAPRTPLRNDGEGQRRKNKEGESGHDLSCPYGERFN